MVTCAVSNQPSVVGRGNVGDRLIACQRLRPPPYLRAGFCFTLAFIRPEPQPSRPRSRMPDQNLAPTPFSTRVRIRLTGLSPRQQ
jgi:hypothetical protein